MTLRNRSGRCAVVCLFLAGSLTGCQGWNKTQNGAALGGLGGAGLGAIIGHQTGHKGAGALIGGLTGAAAGGLIGNAADKADERDAAIAQAHMTRRQAHSDARAMTNREVIEFSRKGISDDLTISTMRNRGGRFDTSPDGIKYLHDMGVTDRVIQAMQQLDRPGL